MHGILNGSILVNLKLRQRNNKYIINLNGFFIKLNHSKQIGLPSTKFNKIFITDLEFDISIKYFNWLERFY